MATKRDRKRSRKTENLPVKEVTQKQAKDVRGGAGMEQIDLQHEGARRTK